MKSFLLKLTCWVLVTVLYACGSTPPKPLLPDGSHRVPINTTTGDTP